MIFRRFSEKVVEIRGPNLDFNFWASLSVFLSKYVRHAEEVLNTEDSVVVIYASKAEVDVSALERLVSGFSAEPQKERETNWAHKVYVDYTSRGTDLDEVSQHLGLSEDEIIHLHSQANYQIAMFGFIPGFAYLTGVNDQLKIPRKDQPSLQVVKGSVAIAGSYTGIYPVTTQGGWYVIGFADFTFLDKIREELTSVSVGDQVTFVAK